LEPATKHRDLQRAGRLARQVGIYTSIPMVLLGGPLAGFLIGRFLDRRFDSDPWAVTLAVGIGFVAGLVQTVRLIRYAQMDSNRSESSNGNGHGEGS
jgi:F0F1-type ATP synthase assembly protein I